ncbi:MAG: mechanosensitive ion channel family protein [Candidatus Nanosalina sp.]
MVFEIVGEVATGTATGYRLTRFIVTLLAGLILTRVVLMPVAKRFAASKVKSVTTQASIENIAGIFSGILFLSLSLQVAGYGGLITILGTVTAALTVAIGFGMRDEVGSLVSGLFIQLDRPFIKGDYIEIEGTRGVVNEIRLRSTVLENVESDKVVVPNRLITSEAMKNFTKGRKTRTSVEIKVDVQNSRKAMDALLESAISVEEVMEKPEPSTWIERIEEEKAILQLECFVDNSRKVEETRSKILEKYSENEKTEEIYRKKEEQE